MIKYISIVIVALLMFGCNSKTEMVKAKVKTAKVQTSVAQSKVSSTKVGTVKKAVKKLREEPKLPAGFVEKKALKPMTPNVPSTCKMWSDGCNTCTRAVGGQASCTIYECSQEAHFSCLQWQ